MNWAAAAAAAVVVVAAAVVVVVVVVEVVIPDNYLFIYFCNLHLVNAARKYARTLHIRSIYASKQETSPLGYVSLILTKKSIRYRLCRMLRAVKDTKHRRQRLGA